MPEREIDRETCTQCGHDFGLHVLVAWDEPLGGGIMFCPKDECPCHSTWDVKLQ